MISMGGCGPLFSAEIARDLGIGRVLVPQLASVFSAFGAATSEVRRERSQSAGLVIPADAGELQAMADALTASVSKDLEADGIPRARSRLSVAAEMRFARQRFELPMNWAGGFGPAGQEEMRRAFIEEYSARYGRGAVVSGAPVEIATLRVAGVGETTRARLAPAKSQEPGAMPADGYRAIRQGSSPPLSAAVVPGPRIEPGHAAAGPVVIDAPDTTVWVPPGATVTMDAFGSLDIRLADPHPEGRAA
jgi:N-methylhydantoinase A